MPYDIETYNRCKKAYVQENKSPRTIASEMNNKPSWQTIENWRKKKDKKGKNWTDYKEEYKINQYSAVSPQKLATNILQEISDALEDYKGGAKKADELVKLSKLMERLVDKKLQVHVALDTLEDYIRHIKKYFPELLKGDTGNHLLESIKDFNMVLRKRLDV